MTMAIHFSEQLTGVAEIERKMNGPSQEPDLRVVAGLERFDNVALVVVAAVGSGILILWAAPALAGLAPDGWSRMRPLTAIGILLSVSSLAFSAPRNSRRAFLVGIISAVAVALIGVATLLTYTPLVLYDPATWILRPAPQTAVCFVLLGVAISLSRRADPACRALADACSVGLIAFALFLLGGIVFSVLEFTHFDATMSMSSQTLFCFVLLSVIVAGRRASDGVWLAIFVSRGIGSQMARVALPMMLATPFGVFALIAWLDAAGILPTNQTRAIAAPLLSLLSVGVMGWLAHRTNHLERQLRQQSLTDPLTNILNRRGFEAIGDYVIRNAQRSRSSLTAFYFDIDGLKRANDSLGHEAGSLIIKTFADLLVATFRKNDVLARIGGDEFVVLAVGARQSASELLIRLAKNIAASNDAGAVPGGIAYSAGYAELGLGVVRNVSDLVAEADRMMYQQKSRKRAA